MRIAAAQLIPYRLPLRHPWRSAHGVITHRCGWLVRLVSDEGLIGYGDCAPLPAAGTETPELAFEQLQVQLPSLLDNDPQGALSSLDESGFQAPAARCALEIALLDLLAQQTGLPLARRLNPNSALSVRANAMIGGLADDVGARVEAAQAAGFTVLKLKVGLAEPKIEVAQLRRLAGMLEAGVSLRLDANGAWTSAQALAFVEGLFDLPIESLEEPLAQPEIGQLQQLQALAAFPLALDESLARIDIDTLLRKMVVRRLVLKPMVLGGVRPAYALARRAALAGMECVATTAVDSAVGVLAAVHLAVALDNELAHGLATSSWLLSDVGSVPRLESGRMLLNAHMNGLGFHAKLE